MADRYLYKTKSLFISAIAYFRYIIELRWSIAQISTHSKMWRFILSSFIKGERGMDADVMYSRCFSSSAGKSRETSIVAKWYPKLWGIKYVFKMKCWNPIVGWAKIMRTEETSLCQWNKTMCYTISKSRSAKT